MSEEAKQVLIRVFRQRTTYEQRLNLLWHADRRTPICCGNDYSKFVDGKGGG